MDAKDRRQFGAACENLAVAFRRFAATGGLDLPFRPLDAAARADAAAVELRRGPQLVISNLESGPRRWKNDH